MTIRRLLWTVLPLTLALAHGRLARDLAGEWEWTSKLGEATTAGSLTITATNGAYSGTGVARTQEGSLALRLTSVTAKNDSVALTIVNEYSTTYVRGAFTSDSTITGEWSATGDVSGTFVMRRRQVR